MTVYDYPLAGLNSPRGVRNAIREWRRRAPMKLRRNVPILYWLLGSGTQPYKMSKEESGYVLYTVNAQNCANCRFNYQNASHGYYVCSHVQGDVGAKHWCRLWRPAGVPREAFPPGQSITEYEAKYGSTPGIGYPVNS